MQWTQINVYTSPEAEDAVAQILMDAGANGVMFGTDGHASVVTAYLSEAGPHSAAGLEARVSALADAGLDPGAARVTMARVDDEDWAESWKQHYQPLTVGHRLLIKPAWIDVASTERLIVELDPGMAFGTGYHPTTVLCLEALEDVVRPGHVVVDIGTGSGILGIAAARLGAASVVAVDTEVEAVEAARSNSFRNDVSDIITVKKGSTGTARELLGDGRADVLVVNILARVIHRMAEELHDLLCPGGTLVAGGIIGHAADGLVKRLQSVGFHLEDERYRDEWCCLIGRRGE